MILGRGGDRWGIPGGGREGDETYEDHQDAVAVVIDPGRCRD